ncbi:alpha/beta fold hydrolase [Mariniflexile gromovii]|uniref:alpha/beta fold hydrolase n=1 Tax=Mariniflexile gromovii TaxID=362523 RepID=UPI00293D9660|nr:alpha/beta hydrolase [Mariniflexile gromovii]
MKNVVLVHGAFAPRSGWQQVYSILTKNGYHTTVVQIPLTSLEDDVVAVNRALNKLDGKAVLVGHSWSGTVITEAGVHPNVASLVFISAFQPDVGENTLQWVQSEPSAPESGLLPPDDKGLVYYDKEKFHAGFAADLTKEQANFMADAQQPIAASCFTDVISKAAWHDKKSFAILGSEDKSINPLILRKMYERSGTQLTEIKGASHVVFMSHPKEVANLIISAAN